MTAWSWAFAREPAASGASSLALGDTALASNTNAIAIDSGAQAINNAAALSTCLRITDNVVLSGGVSYGVEARQLGGRAGMLFAW